MIVSELLSASSITILLGFNIWLLRRESSNSTMGQLVIDGRLISSSKVLQVKSLHRRRIGLLNHTSLQPTEGLWLCNTKKPHTQGMAFAIDMVFLNRKFEVLEILENVLPGNSFIDSPPNTESIIELAAYSAKSKFFIRRGCEVKLHA